ncbi:MAG: hypothetical protein FD180_269 [Planctomycetota bacterium]|nr:MAG: hypothetical protein FD180_269 [Planctomycetota bacterium]
MKSWRWWLSLGAIPLWIAVFECAWALANWEANRRIGNLISEAKRTGVLPDSWKSDFAVTSARPYDPCVVACRYAGYAPDPAPALQDFAFRWDVPPERLWLPFFRGWIRANPEALAELRRGSALLRARDLSDPRGVENLPDNWFDSDINYPVKLSLQLAFCAARVAQIDGDPECGAILADAFGLVRLMAMPDGSAPNGNRRDVALGPLQVLRFLMESESAALLAPGLLESLRTLQPGILRKVAVREARRVNRIRFLLYVNEPRRYAKNCPYLVSARNFAGIDENELHPWHARLMLLDQKLGDSGLLTPLVRLFLANDAEQWLRDAEKGYFRSDQFEEDVCISGERLALMRAAARMYARPDEAAPADPEAVRDLPEELAARVRVTREGSSIIVQATEWTPSLDSSAPVPVQSIRVRR